MRKQKYDNDSGYYIHFRLNLLGIIGFLLVFIGIVLAPVGREYNLVACISFIASLFGGIIAVYCIKEFYHVVNIITVVIAVFGLLRLFIL